MSTSYEMYDGQPPASTAVVPPPRGRPAPPRRDRGRCHAAAPRSHRLARPSGACGRRDTVERVLNRFRQGGIITLQPRARAGSPRASARRAGPWGRIRPGSCGSWAGRLQRKKSARKHGLRPHALLGSI